jgi:hypothetical protein
MAAEENEAIGEGIDQAVGNLDAAAAGSDVIPNVAEIGIGLRSAQMSHKRDVFCLQVSRARPRCFTLSASPGERFLAGVSCTSIVFSVRIAIGARCQADVRPDALGTKCSHATDSSAGSNNSGCKISAKI